MRISTKLLLGFIPLAILTAMVAEVLYLNSKRINESSQLVKEAYQNYSNILEMRRHEKNFSFYREKFYLYRIKDTSGRAAEFLSRLKGQSEEIDMIYKFTRAQEILGQYQRLIDLLLVSEGGTKVEKNIAELGALGHQIERMGEQMINLSWIPIQVANRKAQTYSWVFAIQAALIGVVLAFYLGQLLIKPFGSCSGSRRRSPKETSLRSFP